MTGAPEGVKALAFDVFGTVVDYRTTIVAEGERLGRARGIKIDWAAFADAWRGRYRPAMDRVMRGELPWTNLDALHRAALEELLAEFGVRELSEGEKNHLNGVWHRLRPWGDSVPGLLRLKTCFVLATLSNAGAGLQDSIRHASSGIWPAGRPGPDGRPLLRRGRHRPRRPGPPARGVTREDT